MPISSYVCMYAPLGVRDPDQHPGFKSPFEIILLKKGLINDWRNVTYQGRYFFSILGNPDPKIYFNDKSCGWCFAVFFFWVSFL